MTTITTNKSRQIIVTNRIDVDGHPCKYQSYTINSDDPNNFSESSYPANEESKAIYKANRVEVRKVEAAFEDEVFALVDQMISEKENKQ